MTEPQQSDDEQSDGEQSGGEQSGGEPAASSGRRRLPPAWLVGAGAAVAAVVALVVVRGGGDEPVPRDLTTPHGAAEAFAMSAAAGDVDGVLATSCLGDAGCVAEHGGGVTGGQVTAAKKIIAENVREIGGRFRHAHFTTARAGAQPGTQEVDYRLPGVSEGERNYLVFVHYGDRWLYIATGSATAPTAVRTEP